MAQITLPIPSARTMNSRGTWRTKFIATSRERARAAEQWKGEPSLGDVPVRATLHFILPDRRARDLDGLISKAKPYLDGAADAGILKDDKQIEELIARKEVGTRETSGVTITLTALV